MIFLCVFMCAYVCDIYPCLHACGDLKLVSGVSLDCSPPHIPRQGFSLDCEFTLLFVQLGSLLQGHSAPASSVLGCPQATATAVIFVVESFIPKHSISTISTPVSPPSNSSHVSPQWPSNPQPLLLKHRFCGSVLWQTLYFPSHFPDPADDVWNMALQKLKSTLPDCFLTCSLIGR